MIRAALFLLLLPACQPEVACPVQEDGSTKAKVWFLDADGDGAGNPQQPSGSCEPLVNHVQNADDCDDDDADVRPGVTDDTCDGVDNDCDGQVDEQAAQTWYFDADGDGRGGDRTITSCTAPASFVTATGDCDDDDASVTPGATEACDGKDNDCSGAPDEVITATCYADLDDDGHGDPATGQPICGGECPVDRSILADDCDDRDELTWTGAGEQCDGKDNDCVNFTFPDQGANCGWSAPAHMVATGSVYVVIDALQPWADAAETCDGLGYHLLWLDSEAEVTFVRDLLTPAQESDGVWLGLRHEACTAGAGFQRVDPHYEPARCMSPSAWETTALGGEDPAGAVALQAGDLSSITTGEQLAAVCELSR